MLIGLFCFLVVGSIAIWAALSKNWKVLFVIECFNVFLFVVRAVTRALVRHAVLPRVGCVVPAALYSIGSLCLSCIACFEGSVLLDHYLSAHGDGHNRSCAPDN